MTDEKPSLWQRLQPLLQDVKRLSAAGWKLALYWLGIAARELTRLAAAGWKLARDWLAIAARATWIVLKRLPIASYSFARALFSADYAQRLTDVYIDGASSPAPAKAPPAPAAVLQESGPDSALVLLSLLQQEGRFLDFLQEQVAGYSDQEVGAAARVVHDGCQRVLKEHLSIAPVRDEPEGSQVTLNKGFDPAAERPTGQVVGEPPFTGALVHRGWRALEVRLPQVASSRDVRILAPAEVEL
ncbi:MAG: DUF2760 domain-containing protein [Halochromatium sp.]|uniref:DUF2760 domain-containing protein n=1 Tax=Halochromatium sp. TaxID=2049430 RepID=UPI00397AE77A